MRLLVWLAAATAVAAQEPRVRSLPATLTPGDGVLLFSPASAASAWELTGSNSTASTPGAPAALEARTNATNATASFAFFGSSFSVLGSGAGELAVSVRGLADSGRDPRRAPDWDSPHDHGPNGTHANMTREISAQRYAFNASHGVLYSDNSTNAEWKNVTVQLASGAVAVDEVRVTHRVTVAANRAEEAPLLTLPAVWWGNGSLNGGELQFHGAWEAKNLTRGACSTPALRRGQADSQDTDTEPRYTSLLAGAGSVSLRTPANASFVRLNGHLDEQCAPYDVGVTAVGSQVPNARYRPLCTGRDAVLFEAALDPALQYNVVLRSAAGDGQVLGFTSAQFLSSTL